MPLEIKLEFKNYLALTDDELRGCFAGALFLRSISDVFFLIRRVLTLR
ncbi:MAG: hypothetical protein LBP74_03960 [Treponema sp.]|jgi:hypothetical protein|nr:hypothetical protein [Treponema sp.]